MATLQMKLNKFRRERYSVTRFIDGITNSMNDVFRQAHFVCHFIYLHAFVTDFVYGLSESRNSSTIVSLFDIRQGRFRGESGNFFFHVNFARLLITRKAKLTVEIENLQRAAAVAKIKGR
jgi:hypothetical protein